MPGTIVVALGGNALIREKESGTYENQMENIQTTCEHLSHLIEEEWQVILTHGNGPQVGAILLQNLAGQDEVPAMPLFICGAESQGLIGYMIQQILRNKL